MPNTFNAASAKETRLFLSQRAAPATHFPAQCIETAHLIRVMQDCIAGPEMCPIRVFLHAFDLKFL
jgi:hypothetical protein